jgi:hypothetical protein
MMLRLRSRAGAYITAAILAFATKSAETWDTMGLIARSQAIEMPYHFHLQRC